MLAKDSLTNCLMSFAQIIPRRKWVLIHSALHQMVRQLRTDLAIIDNQSVSSKTLPENRETYGYKTIKAHQSYVVTNTMEIPLGVQTTMLRRPIIKQPTNY